MCTDAFYVTHSVSLLLTHTNAQALAHTSPWHESKAISSCILFASTSDSLLIGGWERGSVFWVRVGHGAALYLANTRYIRPRMKPEGRGGEEERSRTRKWSKNKKIILIKDNNETTSRPGVPVVFFTISMTFLRKRSKEKSLAEAWLKSKEGRVFAVQQKSNATEPEIIFQERFAHLIIPH